MSKLFFLTLDPANNGEFPGNVDRQAEMSVRVWKRCVMVDILGHSIFCPNVVLETLELYRASVLS